jgi:hypothetical protein
MGKEEEEEECERIEPWYTQMLMKIEILWKTTFSSVPHYFVAIKAATKLWPTYWRLKTPLNYIFFKNIIFNFFEGFYSLIDGLGRQKVIEG